MDQNYDVIVVGGGAVGMLSAWRLAQSGRSVLLLDKGQLGAQSSTAAAGMMGAQMEMDEDGPMFRLGMDSRRLFPELAAELYAETGIDIGLQQTGIFRLAESEEHVSQLQKRAVWQRAAGASCEWWSATDAVNFEPQLQSDFGGLYFPDDTSITAPLLAAALRSVCFRYCTVMEGTQVDSINTNEAAAGSSVSVVSGNRIFYADYVVIAAGAWARSLLRQVEIDFPVYPVKGQILSLRPQQKVLSRVVFSDNAYLVPKPDGTLVVGATEEHNAGFDTSLTAGALTALMNSAQKLVPSLEKASFERAWVGLRPGSPTGLPLIGEISDESRIVAAAGHFRNGVLLAPATANLVQAILDGRTLPEYAQALSPSNHILEVTSP